MDQNKYIAEIRNQTFSLLCFLLEQENKVSKRGRWGQSKVLNLKKYIIQLARSHDSGPIISHISAAIQASF